MSVVYFHSPSAETYLWGAERGWLEHHCSSVLAASLDLRPGALLAPINGRHPLWYVTKESSSLRRESGNRFIDFMACAIRVSGECPIRYKTGLGWAEIDPFTLCLNTALAAGSDQLKLAARIHGQCELHAYVEGKNRRWLARIIDGGLDTGIYRVGSGWESVTKLLRERSDEPVVMSYSVCEQFPNPGLLAGAASEAEADDEELERQRAAWDKMTDSEQWDACIAVLRKNAHGLELTPRRWRFPQFHFGETELTGFQVFDRAKQYAEECSKGGTA